MTGGFQQPKSYPCILGAQNTVTSPPSSQTAGYSSRPYKHFSIQQKSAIGKICHADLRMASSLQALPLADLLALSSVQTVLSTLSCCLESGEG